MANIHTTLAELFSAIADAIRGKTGGSDSIKADDFPNAISGITTEVTPEISVSETGLITATAGSKSATKQLPTSAGQVITPSASGQTVGVRGTFMTGNIAVRGDTNLMASNIKNGVPIFGVTGSYSATRPVCTVTVENSSNGNITIATDLEVRVTSGASLDVDCTAGSTIVVACNNTNTLSGRYENAEYVGYSAKGNCSVIAWKINEDANTAVVEAFDAG